MISALRKGFDVFLHTKLEIQAKISKNIHLQTVHKQNVEHSSELKSIQTEFFTSNSLFFQFVN